MTFGGVPAPLLSVQSERVVCIAPFLVLHVPTVQVTSNGSSSNSILLQSLNTAVEVLAVVNTDGSLNTSAHPAAPGTMITVYAAGFGQTVPPSVDGQINGSGQLAASPVIVRIADQDAQIVYAGPAPGQVAGIAQINFILPAVPPGQYAAYVGSGQFNANFDFNAAIINVGQP